MLALPVSLHDTEARSTPRTNLFLSAMISFETASAAIRIRDLSASGARIEGSVLPRLGAAAQIMRGSLKAGGTIMWREANSCGLRFDNPLSLDQWLPRREGRDQMIVDVLIEEVRSAPVEAPPGLESTRNPVTLGEALPQRLAEELAYVARLIEGLGDDLSGESMVVMRHSQALQHLDISAQILGHVAALLVAERPEQAVAAIGMECLRKRLQRVTL